MFRGVKMLRRVLVLRGIATADMSAFQAQAQMYPAVTYFEALFAALRMRLHSFRVLNMLARFAHAGALSPSVGCAAGCLKGRRIVKLVWPGCDSTSIKP